MKPEPAELDLEDVDLIVAASRMLADMDDEGEWVEESGVRETPPLPPLR